MKSLFTLLAVLGLGLTVPVFADHTKCTCDKECAEKCEKGESHECECKSCDCAKTHKCGGDHCKNHEHKKDKEAVKDAKPAKPETKKK